MKPIWDAEAAAAKEKANREGMLKLAREVGVKVPANYWTLFWLFSSRAAFPFRSEKNIAN